MSSLEDAVAGRVWIIDANLGFTLHTGALSPNVHILAACQPTHTTEGRPHPTPPHHVWVGSKIPLQTGSKLEKGPEHTSKLSTSGAPCRDRAPKRMPTDQYLPAGQQNRMSRKDPRNREGLSRQTWINRRAISRGGLHKHAFPHYQAINDICPVSPKQPKHQQSDFVF